MGILIEPLKGYRANGFSGLVLGTLFGTIGIISKPIYGFLGGFSSTCELIAFELLPHIKGEEKEKLKRFRVIINNQLLIIK